MNFLCRITSVGMALLWCLGPAAAAETATGQVGPAQLVYLTEDYPPSNYVDNGVVKGYAVDLLKLIWKRMGVAEQPIEVTNWARAFNQTETTPNTVLFATSRNAEREKRFKWVGPIYQNRYVLVARAGREIHLDSVADAGKYHLGVIREDIGHKLMTEAGLDDARLEKVADFRQLMKMLAADRVDLICVSNTLIPTFADYGGLKVSELQVIFPVKDIDLYYAFNKDTDPALVARFQKTLTGLDAERKRLLKAYGLPL